MIAKRVRQADDEPVFLLGAGCQKGGTTWLYRYLEQSAVHAPGIAKEAAIFDILDVPEHTWGRGRTFEIAAAQLARLERGEPADPRELHRAAMLADPTVYFDFHANLARQDGKHFCMDLTPNYALLPADRFAEIRDRFADRGVRTKVVMLLRDPVDRIWSHIRMHLRSRHQRQPDRPHPRSEAELVLERHTRPTVALRTRYEITLDRLGEVFDPADVHVELYERLFSTESTAKICDFLGIDPPPARFEARVNSSPRRTAALPDEVVSEVAQEFEKTYAHVAARFQLDDMTRWWPSARLLRRPTQA